MNGHTLPSSAKKEKDREDLFKEQRELLFMDVLMSPPKDPRSEPKGRISPPRPYDGKELIRALSPLGIKGRSSPSYGVPPKTTARSRSYEEPRYPA